MLTQASRKRPPTHRPKNEAPKQGIPSSRKSRKIQQGTAARRRTASPSQVLKNYQKKEAELTKKIRSAACKTADFLQLIKLEKQLLPQRIKIQQKGITLLMRALDKHCEPAELLTNSSKSHF